MTTRTINVTEFRYAPTAEGPWGPVERAEQTQLELMPEWSKPFSGYREKADPVTGETIAERVFKQLRVVAYVYKAVADAALSRAKHRAECPVCPRDEYGLPHSSDCPLVAQGFISPDGTRR